MAITDISIPLQYIKSGTLASRPDGQFDGQIFYATDTDASYVWDGTEWQDTTVNLDNVNKLIGNNALNILDLTAQANLTAGINANFERDIYTDNNGYLNTIDAGNTTGNFTGTKYDNSVKGSSILTSNGEVSSSSTPYSTFKTLDVNPDNYVYNVNVELKMTGTAQNYARCQLIFTYADATNETSIEVSNSAGGTYSTHDIPNPNPSKIVTSIALQIKTINSNYTAYERNTSVYGVSKSDLLIQTNAQTIDAGFTKFMIVANEETSGTGSVTYDITFDGTNYQEDLTSFTEYTISDAGTSLILKQKLNAGASSGTASTYNWGVLLW